MSSASRRESRKILLRTAATALIAASPFVYSGAASATVGGVQLTAPVLKDAEVAKQLQVYSLASASAASGNFQLNAPIFQSGKIANESLLFASNFKLSAPTLQGGSTFAGPRSVNQPVQNLLAVPMDATAAQASINSTTFAITPAPATTTVDNSNDLTVTDAETAIDVNANPNHIIVNNTGDLTGGGGINVSTGTFDPNAAPVNNVVYNFSDTYSANLYDDAGNPITEVCYTGSPYMCNVRATTGHVDTTIIATDIDASQSDAEIHVNNGGQINFSGLYGIRTENPAGALIDITNTGDITSTVDTERRVGIFADTAVDITTVVDGPNEIVPGEYTYNSDGQLTGVITEGQHEKTITTTRPVNDLGAITISNGGFIDMGVVDVSEIPPGFRPAYTQSEGIYAKGFGGIDITNQASGTIKVGDFSNGITTVSAGDTTIRNDGRIEIGNQSNGIYALAGSQPSGDIYSHGGDTVIINTGDIVGGMTKAEAAASPNHNAFGSPNPDTGISYLATATGIRVYSLGTSVDGYGGLVNYVETLQKYGFDVALTDEALRSNLPGHPQPPAELTDPADIEAWWASFVPKLENFTTTIVNQGNIDLKDHGLGIYATGMYGEIRAYNSGTITVGNGDSRFADNADGRAMGIYMNNHTISGLADFYAKNEADGIIITGDDGAGIRLQTTGGSATAINEGTIIVGNGGLGDHTTYGETYDWLFPSVGMSATTVGTSFGQTAIASNSGTITTGDLSVGMFVKGDNSTYGITLQPDRVTAYIINEGAVTAGNNSAGAVAVGKNVLVANTGSVTIGDRDLSGFDLPPDPLSASGVYFARAGYGIIAKSDIFGTVYNNGSVTTGDNGVGIYNGIRNYYGGVRISTYQGEDGVVATGDNSIGIKARAGYATTLDNKGRISVGDNSTGVDMSAGFVGVHYLSEPGSPAVVVVPGQVVAANSGIIETGDNSTGVRLQGAIEDVSYDSLSYYITSRDPFSGEFRHYSGTVDVKGEALFQNTGTVRVGANSTAVEITGYGLGHVVDDPNTAEDETWGGVNLYNVGTIDAGAGTAIKINADNDIGSMILNGGTIIGDIVLGAGDDNFLHGQNLDPANGQVLGTGNIIMNGNTIDFGGGENTFRIKRGVISVAGGDDNLITGDNLTVEMDYGEIDARDDFIIGAPAIGLAAATLATTTNFSTLTINGDVSGNFHFAADVDATGASDHLNITGNVLAGSEIGVLINPVEQLKGEVEWRPINIGGTNDADLVEVFGVTGLYADSVIDSEAHFDAASGDIVVNATFGLGHMGTAANAAAVSAANWLTGTLSSYGNRNIHAYTGRKGEGLAVWGYAFQDEGRIHPDSDLQDLSFSEISTGMQAGVQWSHDIAGGRVSVSPMFTYGTVEANLIANTSSSRGHPWAAGLNANYVTDGGIYVDATYQHMSMDVDLKTPQTATHAKGDAKITGQGFNLEAGYSRKLASGLTIQPQLQLTHVKVDMDDFRSSDGIYELSDIDGKSTTLRAGVSVYKVFETTNGAITPMASLSYINAINGKTQLASNGVDFDSDTSGAGYKAEIGILGRYHAWDFAGKVGVSNTSATGSILQPNFTARYALGGAQASKTAAVPQLPEVTEATVKFAAAGSTAAPLATAAPAQDGAPVVSAAYAQTGAEPAEDKDKKDEQPQQTSPDLNPEQAAEQPTELGAEPAADVEADDVSDIVVTGTLIRHSTNSEVRPMSVVTSEDMATKGLITLGDVMKSFTENEGKTEGKASNLLGRFNFGTEEVNFRGLGSGRTLVLVNGRRLADFPLPFGGEQNGADLGTIPSTAVAKVEFLASGASATYGSDAVGGVVNVITKRDMEQTVATLTTGGFLEGYGELVRASVITGNSFARGSYTVGFEGYVNKESLASQSKYFRKHAPFEGRMVEISENTGSGLTPILPQSACAPLGFKFDKDACVADLSHTISLSPSIKQGSGFFDGRYDLTDKIELFFTGMASKSRVENKSNVLFWQGIVVNESNTAADYITRGFSEDELGVMKATADQTMLTAASGAKGTLDVGGKPWYWDVAYSYAWYKTKQTNASLKEEGIKNWILSGASSVTESPDRRYTYFVDDGFYDNQLNDNIVRPVQSSDVDDLVGDKVTKAHSTAQSLTATLNGTVGDLGFLSKPAKFAVRAEYGRQTTEINPDDRSLNTTGEGWFNIGAFGAKGKRDRWAVAAEIDAAALSNLDVVLAARYDHYSDASDITGKFTGQAKFLYRPTNWLKVRGGVGQTFRAPDMFNIYGRQDSFEYVPDFSLPGCYDGSTYSCSYSQVATTRQADPGLTEEHGYDLGLGFIFSPVTNFNMSVDWYSIKLKDLVITDPAYDTMLKEWQCDNDVLDGASQLCADIHSRVIRDNFGILERVIIKPINQSDLTRSGFDVRASYSFESEKLGSFQAGLSYSRVLKFDLTRFKGDAPLDLKYGEQSVPSPANTLGTSFSWYQPLSTGKSISAGLFVQRTGRVYNYTQDQFLEPFYDVNLTAGYQMDAKTQFQLSINNLLNSKPTSNGGGTWPFFWAHLQSAQGRSAYLTVSRSFK